MRLGRRARKAASGASVALATTGLTTCDHGAVDPPPPPFECTANARNGQGLSAFGTLLGTQLRVEIGSYSSNWESAQVTEVEGGTLRSVTVAQPLVVVIDLADDTVTRGSFRVSGTVRSTNGSPVCGVARTFGFTIPAPGSVTVTEADPLPLPERQPARIALLSHEGRDVELEATTAFGGPTTVAWTVTGGQILSRDGSRLRWRLPAEAGLYQAELVADYGPLGFSFDAIVLEVG